MREFERKVTSVVLTLLCAWAMCAGPLWGQESRPSGRFSKAIDLAVLGASEFDATTTYRLVHGSTQYYERNPLVRPVAGSPAVFAVAGGSALLVNYLAKRARRSGHPRAARALQFAVMGVHVFAGIHNLGVSR